MANSSWVEWSLRCVAEKKRLLSPAPPVSVPSHWLICLVNEGRRARDRRRQEGSHSPHLSTQQQQGKGSNSNYSNIRCMAPPSQLPVVAEAMTELPADTTRTPAVATAVEELSEVPVFVPVVARPDDPPPGKHTLTFSEATRYSSQTVVDNKYTVGLL